MHQIYSWDFQIYCQNEALEDFDLSSNVELGIEVFLYLVSTGFLSLTWLFCRVINLYNLKWSVTQHMEMATLCR